MKIYIMNVPDMNIQQFHDEWFRKECPTQTPSTSGVQAGIKAKLRKSPVLRYLKGLLGYKVKNAIKSFFNIRNIFGYPISIFEKEVAISYVKHIFTQNPQVDEKIFEDSIHEIKDILNTQFYFAYNNYASWEKIYPGEKLAEFVAAQKFHRKAVTKKNGVYHYNDFKSLVPDFEYSVLANKCGIDYLPQAVQESLKGSVFIDCGAFVGDSAFMLNKLLAPLQVFALEPDTDNFEILKKNIELNGIDNFITPILSGIGEKEGKVRFMQEGICGRVSETGGIEITITTIDALRKEKDKRIGLIKMDIEGYETQALQGAQQVIRDEKPVLLIAIYHSGHDFFEIPKYIHGLNPSYTMKIVSLNPLAPLYEKYLIAY